MESIKFDMDRLTGNSGDPTLGELRRHALGMLQRALDAVDPERAVGNSLGLENRHLIIQGRRVALRPAADVHLLAFGKAAPAMARGVLRILRVASGLVVTNQGDVAFHGTPMRVVQASHPLPDEGSLRAGREALALADSLGNGDTLLVLVSGGGSAMLEASPVPLKELRAVYRLLLESGLAIQDVNEVRRALSEVKGGRLAQRAVARGANIVGLVISDVVGNPLEDIASGPSISSASRGERAEGILRRSGAWTDLPDAVRRLIEEAAQHPSRWRGDEALVHNFVIADNGAACLAAVADAEGRGYRARLLTTTLKGDAREAGRWLVEQALTWRPKSRRTAIVAGGETTIEVRGGGRGGRNQEMVLSVAEALDATPLVFLSCGTDGVDGNTQAAGAIADGRTMARARAAGLDPRRFLEDNNSNAFFGALGDLILTGPTGTNVADIQIILLARPDARP